MYIRIQQSFVIVASCLAIMPASADSAPQSAASRTFLLSPVVKKGQAFTWLGNRRVRFEVQSDHGPTIKYRISQDAFSCTADRLDVDSIWLSRSVQARNENAPWSKSVPEKPVMLHRGTVFALDGSKLNDNPLCKFFFISSFGSPPGTIARGTTWRVSETTEFGPTQEINGLATVTSLDVEKQLVGIHIRLSPSSEKVGSVFDILVASGGVIVSERVMYDFVTSIATIPKEIGTTTHVVETWKLCSTGSCLSGQ